MDNLNYITAEINIEEKDINENKRIINSFDNDKKEKKLRIRKNIINMPTIKKSIDVK